MGTYQFLDGAKVRIYYRGNSKTCGRCHGTAGACPGGGFAKDCGANGGQRVDLAEHMRTLWQQVGFKPATFELPAQADTETEPAGSRYEGDIVISEEKNFQRLVDRPELKDDDIKKIIGLQIRNFPPTLTEDEIVKFMMEKIDEKITKEMVNFIKNEHSVNAAIDNGLDGERIVAATKEIEFKQSKKKFFGKPLYCRILKNLTPVKVDPSPPEKENVAEQSEPCKNLLLGKTGAVDPDTSNPSVKDKTRAIENKADDKKPKSKPVNQKIAEFGLTNTNAHTIKRNHNDVGSPTSPEVKKSPKKARAVEKQTKQ